MASGYANSVEDGALNSLMPPSTAAAQLVNNYNHPGIHKFREWPESFRRLLSEILEAGDESGGAIRASESNIDVNSKVVIVVIEAGLYGIHGKDPFSDDRTSMNQIHTILEVVALTIKRHPQVLLHVSSEYSVKGGFSGPLYLWLMPRIFEISLQISLHGLQHDMVAVLRSIISAESSLAVKSIEHRPVISRYLRGCLNDLLGFLEGKDASPVKVNYTVPSLETIRECYERLDHVRPSGSSHQMTISKPSTVLRLAATLAFVLSVLSYSGGNIDLFHPTIHHELMSSMLARIWRIISRCNFGSLTNESLQEAAIMSINTCQDSLNKYLKLGLEDFSALQNLYLFRTISKFLISPPEGTMPTHLDTAFSNLLIDVLSCHQKRFLLQDTLHEISHPRPRKQLSNAKNGEDINKILQEIRTLCAHNDATSKPSERLLTFRDKDLQTRYLEYLPLHEFVQGKSRLRNPRKRARLSEIDSDSHSRSETSVSLDGVRKILGVTENVGINKLKQSILNHVPGMSEERQVDFYSNLGSLVCRSAGKSEFYNDQHPLLLTRACLSCRSRIRLQSDLEVWDDPLASILEECMTALLQLPQAQKSRKTKVAAMSAVRRLLAHTANPSALCISTSLFGQWCMQALRSSTRQLRIAAGRTLHVFFRRDLESTVLDDNQLRIFDFLHTLSVKGDLTIQETCIISWGRLAMFCDTDERNLVLLRLVEYLGHSHQIISTLAYNEIQSVCNTLSITPFQLFNPYWRTIATAVVLDLQRRPQVSQQIAELLSITVAEFLRLTQVHTIPLLILGQRREILLKVAEASDRSVRALCLDHANLAATLAFLLIQPSKDLSALVSSLLSPIAPDFSETECIELIKAEPLLTASELLKVAGDRQVQNHEQVNVALQFLASVVCGRQSTPRYDSRKANCISPFFDTHILGIMAHLTDTINDGRGFLSIPEKRRCLGAVRAMVDIARSNIGDALPQISACLQAAIAQVDLSNEALEAWNVMISVVSEDEVSVLIQPTFAIIAEHWSNFDLTRQNGAYSMISQLLQAHSTVIRRMVNHIPSLARIPLMSKFEEELGRLKAQTDVKHQYIAFSQRCQDENAVVVKRALIELELYLFEFQGVLHAAAVNEQTDDFVSPLVRAILDACIRFRSSGDEINVLCARCLGLIGCLDPTRVEASKEENTMLLLSNFGKVEETTDFVILFIRKILVKAFLSTTNPRSQGFLAYAMQELLRFCQFDKSTPCRSRDMPYSTNYVRWMELPESIRNRLTPFLTSKYVVTSGMFQTVTEYPIYKPGIGHGQWLRAFALDLLRNGTGDNPKELFPVLSRIIRLQDISISTFLLPYLVLNVVVGGSETQNIEIGCELRIILQSPLPDKTSPGKDALLSCSQSVFDILDYLSRWMHEKKKEVAVAGVQNTGRGRLASDLDLGDAVAQVQSIETILAMIPAETISRRAVECRSFARALFHWEQFIRQQKQLTTAPTLAEADYLLYEKLQDIYTQIDEPDGIEGISSHLKILNVEQQVLEHRKAGRWTAVQSWYELCLSEQPDNGEVQRQLLNSLKASGQYDVLLNQIAGFKKTPESVAVSLPFAAEAAWTTSRWAKLKEIVEKANELHLNDFNIGVASVLLALSQGSSSDFLARLDRLRHDEANRLSPSNTITLQACHENTLRLHVLAEIETIGGLGRQGDIEKPKLLTLIDQRLVAVGAFLEHKQYILGLRRASMELSKRPDLSAPEISAVWLASARLARKGGFSHQAFNAVLHAARLGDESAAIENARLLWREGHHRKAIQTLESAIASNAFQSHDHTQSENSLAFTDAGADSRQNLPKGRAYLLLAKWIDRAGQTQSDYIIKKYHRAVESNQRWEKGHYYLGRHYNKLLESEKVKPPERQSQPFITGETAKLVIENYLRALCFGAKYMYQTLPRILTLWLQLGSEVEQSLDPKYGNDEKFLSHVANQRRRLLTAIHVQLKKYVDRLPAFVFYTALSQIVARLCHSNQVVYSQLVDIIVKVVGQHPQQALWTLLATVKSSVKERASRGQACVFRVVEASRKSKTDTLDLKNLVTQCQKLSEQLLRVCEGTIAEKATHISITRDLGFNHKLAPCKIVVPLEVTLTAKLPPAIDKVQMRSHKAFSKDTITISSFLEDVLVLNSLQKPRKISVRGSDGKLYALLCKPKDDLRKDQRLMDFNAVINRSLKGDVESSKRRLYIKTYAVTPLNEECGLIEWVDNLKPLRDILLSTYRQKGVSINYQELRKTLDQACRERNVSLFTDKVLPQFPPAFHEWFVELFPEPSAWFEARLRYTRSCAVMSIVGHVLGLGDRHGENILFEEGNGGTFHVDFNCLFDKGLTFEKPEVVPFRLTHNMVDAFGAYGYEGPFRKSSELTLGILRNNEDTLMTVLETFLYDPTTDFIGGKKRKNSEKVPETPEGVLENIRNKVRGMLEGESVPLSVDGYTQKLIEEATDPWNLCQMYIGWCAFF